MNKLFLSISILVFVTNSAYAKKSLVTLVSKSYKEIVQINKDGKKNTKLVEASKVLPGDIVLYKNTINNDDIKEVKNMILNNPIPEHTEYISDSATCENSCDVLFSVDGGKIFDTPSNLIIKDGNMERMALPKEYTNVRWILKSSLKEKSSTYVSFKTKLK